MTNGASMFQVFERPLTAGQVYPCTVQDIAAQLAMLPPEDLEGLHAVGLVPATRKDCNANGRYFTDLKPHIHLYSYPDTLTYRQPQNTKRHDIERHQAVEITCGMQIKRQGSRWICQWESERLRAFILEHVLLHEIGHHVYWMERRRNGQTRDPGTVVKEQFAEDYALRLQSRR